MCMSVEMLYGDGYHLTTCKTEGGPVWTHETLANTRSDCLQQHNITHGRMSRDLYSKGDDRPDILTSDSYSGCDIELDISVAHSWNRSFLKELKKMKMLQQKER